MRDLTAAIGAAFFFCSVFLQTALAGCSETLVIGDTKRSGNIIEISTKETPERSGDLLPKTVDSLDRPTMETPVLLRLVHGVFFIGKRPLKLKPFLSIEGCGPVTTIRGSVVGDGKGLVIGSDNAFMRSLRIENKAEGAMWLG